MRWLIVAAALMFGVQTANANTYLATECFGGDYRFVISLEKGTAPCPGLAATSCGKAHLIEYVRGVQTNVVDSNFAMNDVVMSVGIYGFNLEPRPSEDDKMHSEWLCRPLTTFHQPYVAK
jgi:hypothetical protein